MHNSNKHILIVAGETSGDMHAAHLIEELKRLDAGLVFSGLGGPKMKAAGVNLYEDLTKIAVVGFWEVLQNYQTFKKAFDLILSKINEVKPSAVILVDYPGFNLRLAAAVKKRHPRIKIIYYISPQVWAWKANRVKLIKRCVDKMLVLFRFEKNFYARFGMDVSFAGHPLVDEIKVRVPRKEFLESLGLQEHKLTITLLPGSRAREVETHLPLMLKAAQLLDKELARVQFLIVRAPAIDEKLITKYARNYSNLTIKILEDRNYDAIHASDAAIVASGTATLETAILQTPMVVIYKTSLLTWLLAKLFIKIPYIGLVNVVAGKSVVPECIQYEATPKNILNELKNILIDEARVQFIKTELRKVKEALGPPGASRRAAEEILKTLEP